MNAVLKIFCIGVLDVLIVFVFVHGTIYLCIHRYDLPLPAAFVACALTIIPQALAIWLADKWLILKLFGV